MGYCQTAQLMVSLQPAMPPTPGAAALEATQGLAQCLHLVSLVFLVPVCHLRLETWRQLLRGSRRKPTEEDLVKTTGPIST